MAEVALPLLTLIWVTSETFWEQVNLRTYFPMPWQVARVRAGNYFRNVKFGGKSFVSFHLNR